jgi:membrane protease YdiL (CAAX protease family)
MVTAIAYRFLMPRLYAMGEPSLPVDLSTTPAWTVWGIVFGVSLTAGVSEEAGLRGFLQGPLERRYGLWPAVLLTGVVFWVIHLGHDWVGLPHLFFHVGVSVALGALTSFTGSIRPAVIVHTVADMIIQPLYVFRPAGVWEALTARPIAETGWQSGDALLIGLVAVFGSFTVLALASLRRLARAGAQD